MKRSLTIIALAAVMLVFAPYVLAGEHDGKEHGGIEKEIPLLEVKTYKIDPTHSTLGFAARHMEVGTTRGKFTDYFGEIKFDKENLDAFYAKVIIKAKSIDTGLEARDNHLRNADFFDVENHPTITFESKRLVKKDDGYEIVGGLTMRGVTKEIFAPVTILGPVKSPFEQEVIGISGEVVVNRQDFGISWNDVMPDGGFVVGNDVRLIVDIEADTKI